MLLCSGLGTGKLALQVHVQCIPIWDLLAGVVPFLEEASASGVLAARSSLLVWHDTPPLSWYAHITTLVYAERACSCLLYAHSEQPNSLERRVFCASCPSGVSLTHYSEMMMNGDRIKWHTAAWMNGDYIK